MVYNLDDDGFGSKWRFGTSRLHTKSWCNWLPWIPSVLTLKLVKGRREMWGHFRIRIRIHHFISTRWFIVSWTGLRWLEFLVFHCLPNSALADGNLAEVAGQMGKMVEHPNQSQPHPGYRPDESPCRIWHLATWASLWLYCTYFWYSTWSTIDKDYKRRMFDVFPNSRRSRHDAVSHYNIVCLGWMWHWKWKSRPNGPP